MSPTQKPMTFSIALFPYDRWGGLQPIAEAARLADDLGFFGIEFPEHIIMPVRADAPPVSVVWYDNFVLAAHLATLTKRVRLIFHVTVIPYRPPVQMAKMVSTLDQVSGGRLVLGVGVGWLKGEFRTLGIPFSERAAVTNEYLKAMKALWTQERPSFSGKYTSFANIAFEPKCIQKPHVPIWVGGRGPGPWRRVIEFGDGWAPMTGTVEELAKEIAWIKEEVAKAGRDPSKMDFAYSVTVGELDPESIRARTHVTGGAYKPPPGAGTPQEAIEAVHRHREAGFNHLNIGLSWQRPADLMRRMEWLAAHVMPAFR